MIKKRGDKKLLYKNIVLLSNIKYFIKIMIKREETENYYI
jgi:hypothetical protein